MFSSFCREVDDQSIESDTYPGPSTHLESSRMISLNLSDLHQDPSSSFVRSRPPPHDLSSLSKQKLQETEEYLQLQLKDVEQYEQHYKTSLEILLSKAQGTNYESILQKLYHDKENFQNLEFEKEEFQIESKQLTQPTPRRSSLTFQSRTPTNPQQTRTSSSVRASPSSFSSPSEQNRVDRILSKPLPRNMWQVDPTLSSRCSPSHSLP
jgi:hypothetical protein